MLSQIAVILGQCLEAALARVVTLSNLFFRHAAFVIACCPNVYSALLHILHCAAERAPILQACGMARCC